MNINNKGIAHIPYGWGDMPNPDFRVKYLINIPPSLKAIFPCQGMRCDFRYDGKEVNYMIWPELLDEKFNVILDKSIRAKNEGFANMWIFSNKEKHIRLIKEGAVGWWVIGSIPFARVEITEIFNPIFK